MKINIFSNEKKKKKIRHIRIKEEGKKTCEL